MSDERSARELLDRFIAIKRLPLGERDDAECSALRARLVGEHLALVRFLVRRFVDRGEPYDDLLQIGALGLINALDRFDPDRGAEFATFATPTILGELKRYFRDKRWAVHVPRRLKELGASVGSAVERLTGEFGRSPTTQEVAERLGVGLDEVIEAMELGNAFSPLSLDAAATLDRGESQAIDRLGAEDREIENLADRATIGAALERLSGRDRIVVRLRFFEGQTQREVGERLGVSQMQVSRIEQRALARLRGLLAPSS